MAPVGEPVRGLPAQRLIADRAYEADALRALVRAQGCQPVSPPRRRRNRYEREADKQRRGIEAFARLKQWRRIATRQDKLASNFPGLITRASIMLWLT